MSDDHKNDNVIEGELKLRPKHEVETPRMFRVIMHNDHYTTMDFVVEVLVKVFHKPAAEATRLMLEVHKKGWSVCGIYTHDIAETKTTQVHRMARERGYPLKCSYEEV